MPVGTYFKFGKCANKKAVAVNNDLAPWLKWLLELINKVYHEKPKNAIKSRAKQGS